MFDFLFKRKKNKKEENKKEERLTSANIGERLEKEKDRLPAPIKKVLEKDPSIKERFVKIAKQMEADGVDMSSPSAMRKWAKANQKRIREEEFGTVKPVVKGKEPGRNDPCPCGSGKKYKKCCGANK